MVKENTLRPGHGRLGWLYDGNDETPHIAVMLQDTEERIELSVPLRTFGQGDQYSRWFGQGVNYGDDPDRTKYDYHPPKTLLFVDPDGSVALVGCLAAGTKQTPGAGVGYIVPNYAVLGGRSLKYDRINGLRTEIPGLAQWTGLTSQEVSWKPDDDGLIKRVNVTLESPPAVPLSRTMNLTLEPTWSTSRPEHDRTLASHDIVYLQTRTKDPRSWHDHSYPHLRIRELLIISAWHPFGFSHVLAHRTDDPERTLDGKPVQERWAETATHAFPKNQAVEQQPRYLFTLKDIGGATGVRRWLRLRRSFQRAIQPVIAVHDQRGFLETQILHTGTALEGLGHQLGVEDGKSLTHQVRYRKALNRIMADLKHNPLSDPEDWKDRSQDSYMGVKHPDREVPEGLILAETLRQNLLVIRLWVAGRLGVNPETLEKRLNLDPHTKSYLERD